MSWFKLSEISEIVSYPKDKETIIKYYREGNEMVRYHMIPSLAKLAASGDEEAYKLLEYAADHDPSELVRNIAGQQFK